MKVRGARRFGMNDGVWFKSGYQVPQILHAEAHTETSPRLLPNSLDRLRIRRAHIETPPPSRATKNVTSVCRLLNHAKCSSYCECRPRQAFGAFTVRTAATTASQLVLLSGYNQA